MKNYIGCTMVQAEEMARINAWEKGYYSGEMGKNNSMDMGYHVIDESGNHTWMTAEAFEKRYYQIRKKNRITEMDCIMFTQPPTAAKIGHKTTVVMTKSLTGFEYLESSSCVDETRYDEKMGRKYAMEKIRDRVWSNLGFVLQWAIFGLDKRTEK